MGASALDLSRRCQQFGRINLGDRTRAHVREQVALEAPQYVVSVSRGPALGLLATRLKRYRFEAVGVAQRCLALLGLALSRWSVPSATSRVAASTLTGWLANLIEDAER